MFIDPSGGSTAPPVPPAPAIASAKDMRLGVLDNGKTNADKFLRMVADILVADHGVSEVTITAKEALSKPAPPEVLDYLVPRSDFVITGIGDCGSCSTCCVHDGIEIEKRGIPGVAICTEAFKPGLDVLASMRGMANYQFAIVPHPLGVLFDEELQERAKLAAPQVIAIATDAARRSSIGSVAG